MDHLWIGFPRRVAFAIHGLLAAMLLASGCSSTPKSSPPFPPGEDTKAFDVAKTLLDEKDYEDAQDAFEEFVERYADSSYAEEAAFLLTKSVLAQGDAKQTFLLYKQFLKDYPLSEHLPEIEENLYAIGLDYLEGRRKGFLGIFGGESIGIDVLEYVVETFPRGKRGVDATRVLGNYHYDHEEWPDAIAEYGELRKNYPESEWKSLADFRIATSYFNQIRGAEYDRDLCDKAREEFSNYIRLFPEGSQIQVAREKLRTARELLSHKDYLIGRFYVSNGKPDAAVRYYRSAVEALPECEWAERSRVELHRLVPPPSAKASGSATGRDS